MVVTAMVFPIVKYGCESWAMKKAECERIDVFELWCWGRLLRVPRTARRSNQSILKEINPEYSLEGLMLKLKLQYFGHLMQRADSLEKTLLLGKTEGKRQQRMRWLDSIINSMDMNLSKLQEIVKDKRAWHAAIHEVTKSWTRLSNWTTTTKRDHFCINREAGLVATDCGCHWWSRKGGPSALTGLHEEDNTVGFISHSRLPTPCSFQESLLLSTASQRHYIYACFPGSLAKWDPTGQWQLRHIVCGDLLLKESSPHSQEEGFSSSPLDIVILPWCLTRCPLAKWEICTSWQRNFCCFVFIVIKYTYHKINHFQVYSSVVLIQVTSLCNKSPELFSSPFFEVYLLHNVVLSSTVQQRGSVIKTYTFFIFFSTVVYHGLLNIVPWALQKGFVCPSCISSSHLLTQPPTPSLPHPLWKL